MDDRVVLVVGTTSDYIDIIQRRFPGRTIFLTDARCRNAAIEPAPSEPTELLCDLNDIKETLQALQTYVAHYGIEVSGVVCFDCESMLLTANIARELSLTYVSVDAVLACRSKYESKKLWKAIQLPCPEAELVNNISEAQGFLRRTGGTAVLKPLSGSGSEYVFICSDEDECARAFSIIESKLLALRNMPEKSLYSRGVDSSAKSCACVMEEFINGDEYSCDFAIDGDRLQILRIARKIHARGMPFGTTLAYVVPAVIPSCLNLADLRRQLHAAAHALGIERAICMVDLMVRDGRALMIEMTPRPGGDCLPPLLLKSSEMDVIKLAIDFAEGHFPLIPAESECIQLVGLRLFADKQGVITSIESEALKNDSRVIEYHAKAGLGHNVILPPEDYDSQNLGHVIFRPSRIDISDIENECVEIAGLLRVKVSAE